jgi:4a-hydroxytetrahydrobiopterin dehydratase
MELLSEEAIAAELAGLPGWEHRGNSISTVVKLKDFRAAMLFASAVGYLAEQANHHPDMTIQWNKVTLALSTHSAGGLTGADFALANRISALGAPS